MITQFGERDPDRAYRPRPSAYMVLLHEGRVATVINESGRYMLPGGGIDPGETPEACAIRETDEETGWAVRVVRSLGEANQYIVSADKGPVNKLSTFFLGELVDEVLREPDGEHEVVWLTRDEFAERTLYESHVWAIDRATRDQATD